MWGKWKSKVVKTMFLPHDAKTILGIPISSTLLEDSEIWNASPNDNFSVRSAYKFSVALMMGCFKSFGGKFGAYKFLVRLSILLGGLVKISYLVFLILKREVFWWIVCVSYVVWRSRPRVTCFGPVLLLQKCGS